MARDTIKNENAGLPIVTGIRELGGRTARKRPRSWKNLSYVTRMTLSFAAVAAMTTLLAIVVLSIVWNEHFASYTRENMFATARATAAGIAREYERVGGGWTTEVLAPAVNAAANNAGVGVAVIDAQGVTRYDSSLVFEESDGFGIGQSLQPTSVMPPVPSAPLAPKLDHQRMDTIQEDPSTDSHADEDGFEKDPFPNSSAAAKSFEDLTDHPVTRSEKASSFKLQRQNRVDSKETEC